MQSVYLPVVTTVYQPESADGGVARYGVVPHVPCVSEHVVAELTSVPDSASPSRTPQPVEHNKRSPPRASRKTKAISANAYGSAKAKNAPTNELRHSRHYCMRTSWRAQVNGNQRKHLLIRPQACPLTGAEPLCA